MLGTTLKMLMALMLCSWTWWGSCDVAESIYFPSIVEDEIYRRSTGPTSPPGGYNGYVDDMVSRGVTNLCLSLDRAVTEVNKARPAPYHVFSPLSIASALALLLLGSNGKTFMELSTLLGWAHGLSVQTNSQQVHEHFAALAMRLDKGSAGLTTIAPPPGQTIRSATALFVQNDFGIREQYKRASTVVYGSDIFSLDFRRGSDRAQQVINSWAESKTNGLIKDILPYKPPPDTKLVIVTTLYFKADWERPFSPELTVKRPFYANGRDQKATGDVTFMGNGGDFLYYADGTLDSVVLGLPYKGREVTFYVVMPQNSNAVRLRELQTRLNTAELRRLADSAQPTPCVLLLPRMRLATSLRLDDELKYLGLNSLFSSGEADLSLITPGVLTNVVKQDVENVFGNQGTFTANSPITFSAKLTDCQANNSDCQKQSRNVTDKIIKKREIQYRFDDSIDFIRASLNRNPERYPAGSSGLYVDQVLHKVTVDVTEAGTEAAAATGVAIARDGAKRTVRVDVPFLFFIRHEATGLIMFWGTVTSPPTLNTS